ncbi:hypothetical protein HanPSC8_Chr10g0412371 [Helianthus annuus]|nr:hypothetical protein HanPSC8_Chr10g0412371 [Helianthus annuus]
MPIRNSRFCLHPTNGSTKQNPSSYKGSTPYNEAFVLTSEICRVITKPTVRHEFRPPMGYPSRNSRFCFHPTNFSTKQNASQYGRFPLLIRKTSFPYSTDVVKETYI